MQIHDFKPSGETPKLPNRQVLRQVKLHGISLGMISLNRLNKQVVICKSYGV
jgi:hypothetical protein